MNYVCAVTSHFVQYADYRKCAKKQYLFRCIIILFTLPELSYTLLSFCKHYAQTYLCAHLCVHLEFPSKLTFMEIETFLWYVFGMFHIEAMEGIDLGETTHKKPGTTVPESIHSFSESSTFLSFF